MRHKPATITAKYLSVVSIIALVLSLAACQKEVHIDLGSTAPQMVVQGQIENGQPPFVILNNTIGFFSSVDLGTLQNSFIHGAAMTVSDGTNTIALKEYS